MNYLRLKLALFLMFISLLCLKAQNNSLKLGMACYAEIEDETRRQWIDERFKLRVQGFEPTMNDVLWMGYFDIYGFYVGSWCADFKDWARSNNINYEEVLLHSKVNFT